MKLMSILIKHADFLEGLRLNLFGGSARETIAYLKRRQKKEEG